MFSIITIAFWILGVIAVVNPIFMALKCRKESDEYSANWYLKNHTRPSSYLGIHVSPATKGYLKTPEDDYVFAEITVFTLGFFFFYWQVTFKSYIND